MADALRLHPDRFFPPDRAERDAARAVYDETAGLPIVSPHGHVDPALLAEDRPFPEPAELLITPDHYVFRMLHSQGVPLDALGVPRADGSRADVAPREVWRLFCAHWHAFAGTPTRAWMEYELHELFSVEVAPSADTADRIYDQIAERLASPEYRPRVLFERFGIETLATTDAASSALEHHRALDADDWNRPTPPNGAADGSAGARRVIPTFRPDALVQIARAGWSDHVQRLGELAGGAIEDYDSFAAALRRRRADFAALGAVATDHGAETARTGWLPEAERDAVFARALGGAATAEDEAAFTAHMLMAFAEMSADDGLVMQLHVGALRNHDRPLFERFGADKGADIPVATEFTRALRPLLSEFAGGTDRDTAAADGAGRPPFRLIAFTLDESTYARELAPLAGYYPGLVLGPAWWFHDSVEGMLRYRERTTETAGFYNTAGFNDDTRAFCSIPARHDLARRVDAHYLGRLVARHQLGLSEAREVGRALAYDLPRRAYRLDRPAPATAGGAAHARTDGVLA
ncbi:glucuronate isomerase [Rubrivirga sp. S365]|uniref:Uronate isomerase n=1 Tax=Rubrivirga litoralis TaxID=3075598 RepID=A0ABU3BNV0_9BACT|nr:MULTISPECIES: glucuronate isomerase [unclassified Rubrivirga]MDT0630905.1 glucuronate isomerase [Rubrivirga sp. F394]MDT7856548.1 glucuronate isomerase [Rubrivirga sp. S365]